MQRVTLGFCGPASTHSNLRSVGPLRIVRNGPFGRYVSAAQVRHFVMRIDSRHLRTLMKGPSSRETRITES